MQSPPLVMLPYVSRVSEDVRQVWWQLISIPVWLTCRDTCKGVTVHTLYLSSVFTENISEPYLLLLLLWYYKMVRNIAASFWKSSFGLLIEAYKEHMDSNHLGIVLQLTINFSVGAFGRLTQFANWDFKIANHQLDKFLYFFCNIYSPYVNWSPCK